MVETDIYLIRKRWSLWDLRQSFSKGRSQAVRLSKEFRFKGTEVKIRKEGEKVIVEPIEKTKWPDGFWDIFRPDPGFEIPKPMPPKEFSLD